MNHSPLPVSLLLSRISSQDFTFTPKEVKQMFWALVDGNVREGAASEDKAIPKAGTVFVDLKGRGGKGAPVSAAYRCPPHLLPGPWSMWIASMPLRF